MAPKKTDSKKFNSFTQDESGSALGWSQGLALATGLLSLRRVIPKPILWTVAGIGVAAGVAMYLKNHKAEVAEKMA